MYSYKKARLPARQGFTLIELLVVIAIIGILASIISVSMVSARAKGRDARRVADIRTLQLALETYYNDNSAYPNTLTSLIPTYLPSLPKDPKDNTTAYFYTAYDLTSAGTSNCNIAPRVKYHLGAVMESDDATNPVLKQDNDFSAGSTYTACQGSGADFNGNANTGGTQPCVGTSAAILDACYDVTN